MREKRSRLITLALVLILVVPAFAGCGSRGRPARASYIVKQGGITIGGQQVNYLKDAGAVTYSANEHRPFEISDTTTYRKLTVTPDLARLKGYYANTTVPGASYRTYINPAGDRYYFLDDQLQIFNYVPSFSPERGFLPFEPDSAALLQVLVDKFLAARVDSAAALVIMPSKSSVLREVFVAKQGADRIRVTGEGVPDLSLTIDSAGLLTGMQGGGLVITTGSAGTLDSRPFAPTGKAREVQEVRVPTTDKLSNGDSLELAGSFYIPATKGPYRSVILVGEFGPEDRTGAGFLGRIAEQLTDRGMAVLTCDKRGVPRSQGKYSTYTYNSAVLDLNSEVDYLVLRGDVDANRIALVGFGEGGALACRVAASNPYVTALALMATPSVPLFPDLAGTQVEMRGGLGLLTKAEVNTAGLNIANLVNTVASTNAATIKIQGHELFLGWMRSQEGNSALASIGSLTIPVLVMQGGMDGNVPAKQSDELMRALEARGKSTQELALYDKLGHYFGPLLLEAQAVPYRDHPNVDTAVLEKLSGWLDANLKSKKQ